MISRNERFTILGHDNIDVDSVISGILLEKMFKHLNYDVKFKILESNISKDTIKICKKVNINPMEYISDGIDINEPVFLVDHHVTKHSNNVLGCIDHHPTKEIIPFEFVVNENESATAKLIYKFMKIYKMEITKEIIELVLISIFVDTCSLKSSKTNPIDITWTKDMCEKYNLDYDFFYNEGLCLNDLSDDISTLATNGCKEYLYYGHKVKSSYIQVKNNNDLKLINNITNYLKDIVVEEGLSMWVFLVTSFEEDKTYEYRITTNNVDLIVHNKITSRGTTIMPKIEDYFRCKGEN